MGLSRRPGRSPLGKRTAELRTMTDMTTRADLDAKAMSLGLSHSEAVELACQIWVYGQQHVVNLHLSRIEEACEIG